MLHERIECIVILVSNCVTRCHYNPWMYRIFKNI